METSKNEQPIPAGYVRLQGSERRPSPNTKLLGAADAAEVFKVTIVLRRRPDGEPMPDFDHFKNLSFNQRKRLTNEAFAAKYGAHPDDIAKVVAFSQANNLAVLETNAARRTVVVLGTVEQMTKAFGVSLGKYEHTPKQRGRELNVSEVYRGRDGFIHIPQELAGIIIGVFGLDNKRISKRGSAGDPPNTNPVTVPQLSQLYNFPTNSAAGQRIAVLSEGGYSQTDLQTYYNSLPASYTGTYSMPNITPVTVDASNDSPDGETTQDICIAFSAAPGADISVYFTTYDQAGWHDAITRIIHPNAGDAVCTVITTSFYMSNGDDADTLSDEHVSTSWVDAVHMALQDAAMQGVTFCVCSADYGVNMSAYFGVDDGKQHVTYPASDPWALGVGGTTVGNISGSSFDEYVWNDPGADLWGTTGGGISDYFTSLPSYQTGAGVPLSLVDNHVGRGVPDVAANASLNSGISGIVVNGSPMLGNGTSASTPFWAGLIAVVNAAIGRNVGFVNPLLYELGSSVFRDIDPPPGPADNGNGGVAGYPAGAGWDACTGWGSPNGVKLLNGLISKIVPQTLEFWVDKNTFGKDEVSDIIADIHSNGTVHNAFWLVVDGFNLNTLGAATPSLSGQFDNLTANGITITPGTAGVQYELGISNQFTPQRVRFPFDITFTSTDAFPVTGANPITELLSGEITIDGNTLNAETAFELTAAADPYFTNVDSTNSDSVFWLSQDLRVFTVTAGQSPVTGAPAFTSNPYQSIQSFLGYLNSTPVFTTPSVSDPLNALPDQTGYETGDTSVTPLNASNQQNYNFAIARVRLRGSSGDAGKAEDVRVFFRLFIAASCDTDFQPSTTYKSDPDAAGNPGFPLASGTGAVDPQGNSIQTLPFFSTNSTGTNDYDGSVPNGNIRTIIIPDGSDNTWVYFGCFLDVYDASNNSKFPGTHHCIVAQIAYDGAPIINPSSFTLSPENSDKLAQRNLQITLSGNPGPAATHRIPQTFDLRPSKTFRDQEGNLTGIPDELMIDWGNIPVSSTAKIYLPQVSADEIIQLASELYGPHLLSAADAHTIQCNVVRGVTYIPIPSAPNVNFDGLFKVDLPIGVVRGQEFNILVRRIAATQTPVGVTKLRENAVSKGFMNWRYVTGTFQVKIPVTTEEIMLRPEENTLAILKWRLQNMSPLYRWYPVLQRYIEYISARVDGSGGDASSVKPSPTGIGTIQPGCPPEIIEEECECMHRQNRCIAWAAIALVAWIAFWVFTIWGAMHIIETGALSITGAIVFIIVFLLSLLVSVLLIRKALFNCGAGEK